MCFSPILALQRLSDKKIFFPPASQYSKLELGLSRDYRLLRLPCGICMECRLGYARDWAYRCVLESKSFEFNYYLTLTYDDSNLPVKNYETGEVLAHATLKKEDVHTFINSVRQYFHRRGHDGIRFFMAGEYGDLSMRPHYHILFFNLPLFDLKFFKVIRGNPYFVSQVLLDIWNKGYVLVSDVTSRSASYVARYCLKKCKDLYDYDKYDSLGIVGEYTNCSRRPGLGRVWFDKNKDKLFRQGFVDVSDGSQSVRIYPSKYFKRLFREEMPLEFEDWSNRAGFIAEQNKILKLSQTSMCEEEYDLKCRDIFEFNHRNLFLRSDI